MSCALSEEVEIVTSSNQNRVQHEMETHPTHWRKGGGNYKKRGHLDQRQHRQTAQHHQQAHPVVSVAATNVAYHNEMVDVLCCFGEQLMMCQQIVVSDFSGNNMLSV